MKIWKILRADILQDLGKSMGNTPGEETPDIPVGPGDSTVVMWWKGLGRFLVRIPNQPKIPY
jgi:hypothetical protein